MDDYCHFYSQKSFYNDNSFPSHLLYVCILYFAETNFDLTEKKIKKSIEANQLIDSVKNLNSKGDKKWHNHLVVSILYQIQQFTLATQGSLV